MSSEQPENEKVPPQEDSRPEIMTLQHVADYLGFHPLTIYKLIQKGRIPAAKVGGSWRFKRDVLEKWIEENMKDRMEQVRKRKAA